MDEKKRRLYTEGLEQEFAAVPQDEQVQVDGEAAQVVPLEALGVTWS